jgi:DNA-binding MarR family transcriptional regulator
MKRTDELRYLILAAQREGSRLFAEQVRPLGLTPSQAEVLSVLHQAQPLSLIELGEHLVCESGSPSRLANGLVEAGLVARVPSPTDQRKVVLSLTSRGAEVHARVVEVEQRFTDLVGDLGDEATIATVMAALWRFVGDKPAGQALARRLRYE